MKAVRRSDRPAEQIQPDPMLQERRANPIALGVAALFALTIVCVVFYGLSREVGPATVATSTEPPASTSGQAPAGDATAPAPNDKSTTAAKNPEGGKSSGQAQPANQGQSDLPGRSGESR